MDGAIATGDHDSQAGAGGISDGCGDQSQRFRRLCGRSEGDLQAEILQQTDETQRSDSPHSARVRIEDEEGFHS